MLIVTLPTVVNSRDLELVLEIASRPEVSGVRYNSGGMSPYSPRWILEEIKKIADRFEKILYLDLEGRQARVAHWSPLSRGVATLNRDFKITLPGLINFRRVGWFEIVNALPAERKIFFNPKRMRGDYYLGESQSVNIVAQAFEIDGYLNGLDLQYLQAAADLGIDKFMLSFAETQNDIDGFRGVYRGLASKDPGEIVLKIESLKGIEFVKNSYRPEKEVRLMAARDDLFLSFVGQRDQFLAALRLIAQTDKKAIVASRLMAGLEYSGELTIGDLADLALMREFGYEAFMWQDELAGNFQEAMRNWTEIALPILSLKNKGGEVK